MPRSSLGQTRRSLPLCLALLAATALAQVAPVPTTAADPSGPAPYTLHVFSDLVQIPALVLGDDAKPIRSLQSQNFTITLDDGPKFHPTHARLEGDDPLSLALLIDASGGSDDLLDHLPEAAASFAADSLQPRDSIAVYAVDCNLIRTARDLAPDPAAVRSAVVRALQFPALHGTKKHSACGGKLALWGSLASIATSIGNSPGRRVIVALSNGSDTASKINWRTLKNYATAHSITLFGLTSGIDSPLLRFNLEPTFNELCEYSGGLLVSASSQTIASDLNHLVALLRSRYILEFPRPGNAASGEHVINVTLIKRHAFIRPAGISIPIRDPTLASDPTNVPFDPARVPTVGSHRPLPPPR